MKVIFLDIDGVLNTSMTKARSPCGAIGIENSKVKILKHIVKETNARIILTSTWKRDIIYTINGISGTADGIYLVHKLSRQGLKLTGCTEDNIYNRGYGINEYLKTHKVESFIVLDDDIFKDYEEYHLIDKLILCNDGLTDNEADKAIKLLNVC